jgi:3-oxoacyl-[acyl-carrier protein] reductase
MSKILSNKIALVTGASRGIGAAIAKRLAADGAEVIVHYGHSPDEANKVVAAIAAAGGKASAVQADLGKSDGATKLAAAVKHSRIDILVNNAGIAPFASIEETTEETFDQLTNVNMKSVFFVTQKLLAKIPEGGRTSICRQPSRVFTSPAFLHIPQPKAISIRSRFISPQH